MATGPDPQNRRLLAVAYSASSVLTGPAFLGILIDWIAGSFPWCTVAGVLVGMGGLFVLLIRLTQSKDPRK